MKFAQVVVLLVAAAGTAFAQKAARPSSSAAEAKEPSTSVDPKDWLDSKNLKVTTATQSDERAARVLPMKGSEDVSNLLVPPKVAAEKPDYGPVEAVEWIIDIAPTRPTAFKRSQILSVFTRDWREKNSLPQIYGRGSSDNTWHYVNAADVPDEYDQLALGIDFSSPLFNKPLTESQLNKLMRASETAAKRLGAGKPRARMPVKAAVARSVEIRALQQEFESARAVVLLAAPEGKTFEGKPIWDVMMCLGLRWGDMDQFHWENDTRSPGDDHIFSVSSSTAPGYFLPEQIADGRLQVGSLVFDFSIPRSVDPMVALNGMLAAATYAQKRLGGELVDVEGQALNANALRKRVADITSRLTQAGFPPGHGTTMRTFF